MNKRYLLLCLLGCLIFGTACHKKNVGDTGPVGAQGSTDTGTIEGYVHVYDQWGKPVTSGLNTVQLTLKGGRMVNADDSGHYVFDKVGAGNYYLTVSGPGLATTMAGNVNLIKDTTERNVLISMAPTSSLKRLYLYPYHTNGYLQYTAIFDSSSNQISWILFVDNKPNVSNTNYKLVYTRRTQASPFASQIRVPLADLADGGILWGDSVYVAAYAYVGTDSSKYEDVTTGKTIYSAVGGAPILDTTSAP